MKKEIKKHENIYLHIKRKSWFIAWRIFWGFILSVIYWFYMYKSYAHSYDPNAILGNFMITAVITVLYLLLGVIYFVINGTIFEDKFL